MGELTECAPMVSYSTGSMNSLLDKLTKLGSRPEIKQLHGELEIFMKDYVDKLVKPGAADDVQVKVWLKQVREMAFDMEDGIDFWPQNDDQIRSFIAQIHEARERCKRCNLLLKVNIANNLGDVRPHQLVTTDAAELFRPGNPGLVALDGPIGELGKHLQDEDEYKKLKVVSIVGTGGIGKTTLAKKLYEHELVRRRIQCNAFVCISRKNSSIKPILQNILRQIMSSEAVFTEWQNEQKVIAELWEQLSRNRYFVVLDGIWSIRAWRIISCAFPDNNLGSRILITTRIKDVANSCSRRRTDVVHEMQPLSKENSKYLFRSTISLGEERTSVDKMEGLLKMCYGVPSAIIVAAGLLDRTSSELTLRESVHSTSEQTQQEMIDESILSAPDQVMRNILAMSYDNLCVPLKSCFLYLGVFRADYTIKKDRLIRLWVAEGFIPRRYEEGSSPRRHEEGLWETGECYFYELIFRRLIQPVYARDDDYQVVGCTVNGVILDFIESLSREENFATTAAELSDGPFPFYSIRRFSLDCSNKDEADTVSSIRMRIRPYHCIRSLTLFGDVEGMLRKDVDGESIVVSRKRVPVRPPGAIVLTRFELTRVLDLEDCSNLENCHLEGIGALVMLGYLGLGGTGILELPEEIGHLLRLETLDVRRTRLTILPASIARLPKLVHLLVEPGVRLPSETSEMHELEEMGTIMVDGVREQVLVVELLRRSQRMKVLSVTFGANSDGYEMASKIRSFVQLLEHSRQYHVLHLQRFEVSFSTSGLPHLHNLIWVTHLRIKVSELDASCFLALGHLPKLVLLNIAAVEFQGGGLCTMSSGDFPSLRVFSLVCEYVETGLQFDAGAMPQLHTLVISYGSAFLSEEDGSGLRTGELLTGLEQLPRLAQVHFKSGPKDTENEIRSQLSKNPNKPTFFTEQGVLAPAGW